MTCEVRHATGEVRVDKDTFALYCRTDFTLYTWHTQGTTTLLHRSRRLPLRVRRLSSALRVEVRSVYGHVRLAVFARQRAQWSAVGLRLNWETAAQERNAKPLRLHWVTSPPTACGHGPPPRPHPAQHPD